jgi:hypothetical protein
MAYPIAKKNDQQETYNININSRNEKWDRVVLKYIIPGQTPQKK